MPNDVYSVGGYANVQAGPLTGNGAPSTNFKGQELGQYYFDRSVSPPNLYIWNGQTWIQNGSATTLVSTTSITAGTTITAAGDITTTAGNVVISGPAKQLQVEGGAVTDFIGTATLVAGTVTVANTNIAATDRIFVSRSALNASPALGSLIYTISPGASFTVASYSDAGAAATTDVSSFAYFIVRQL